MHFLFGFDDTHVDVKFFFDGLDELCSIGCSAEGFGSDGGDFLRFPLVESFGEGLQRADAALHGLFGEFSACCEFFAEIDRHRRCVERFKRLGLLRGCLSNDHAAGVGA